MTSHSLPHFYSGAPEAVAYAARFLESNSTLHALLQQGGEVLDVIIQDEFSHDVIARLPSPNPHLVVFDST